MRLLQKLALSTISLLLFLLALEGLARAWVWVRWPASKAYELTHATETRGRFRSHPMLGYTLTPGFHSEGFTHNALGLRGKELARDPGFGRVALLGASTVYGIYVADHQTSAAVLQRRLREAGLEAEVINGGVPGWTSHETLASFGERIAPLRPDVVVVMDGRNEAFPQLWRGYRDDYAHYRDPDYQLVNSNLAYKRVFRRSHLAMVVVSRGELFGFSPRREHPLYGALRLENKPSPEEAQGWAAVEARERGFQTNLLEVIEGIEGAGGAAVLATVPSWMEGYASGVLEGTLYREAVGPRIRRNNALVRSLAAEHGLPLADLESLSRPELMKDDCHFNAAGEEQAAGLLFSAVAPLLRRPGRPDTQDQDTAP